MRGVTIAGLRTRLTVERESANAGVWPVQRPTELAHTWMLAWNLWSGQWSGAGRITSLQHQRLVDLVQFARRRSPYYSEIYRSLPRSGWTLAQLPVVTKRELMDRFDDVVTNRQISWNVVKTFVDMPRCIGAPLLGKYMAWRTSGTTGTPGVFLHDANALAVYDALLLARGWPNFIATASWAGLAGSPRSVVLIAADGGHYAGIASWRRLEQVYPWFSGNSHVLPVVSPMARLVDALNELRPAALITYPSVMALLATEQRFGRLRMRPALLVSGGEQLVDVERARIEATFECRVQDVYACSECDYVAFGCRHGRLHVNAEWIILEAVDSAHSAVGPGAASHTTLLTNLVNRVQPIIRYDLGDSITVCEEPCPCGSVLPAIRIEGRTDDMLRFSPAPGRVVAVSPMAIADSLEQLPAVRRFQVIQTGAMALAVRLEAEAGTDELDAWSSAQKALNEYMAAQGLSDVTIVRASETPCADPRSGKFRHVIRAIDEGQTPS